MRLIEFPGRQGGPGAAAGPERGAGLLTSPSTQTTWPFHPPNQCQLSGKDINGSNFFSVTYWVFSHLGVLSFLLTPPGLELEEVSLSGSEHRGDGCGVSLHGGQWHWMPVVDSTSSQPPWGGLLVQELGDTVRIQPGVYRRRRSRWASHCSNHTIYSNEICNGAV